MTLGLALEIDASGLSKPKRRSFQKPTPNTTTTTTSLDARPNQSQQSARVLSCMVMPPAPPQGEAPPPQVPPSWASLSTAKKRWCWKDGCV